MTVPNKQKPWETAREARVRRVRSIVFVLVCAAVSACSGPHAAPTIAFAEFPDTLARRICGVQSQCNPPPWFEMEGCVWRQRTSWDMDVLRAAFEAVPLGVTVYDGEAAAACLSSISCENLATDWVAFFSEDRTNPATLSAPDCGRVLTGTIANHQSCRLPFSCKDGVCLNDPGSSEIEPCAHCEAPRGLGAPCTRDLQCSPELRCRGVGCSASGTCTSVCKSIVVRKVGESCTSVDIGAGHTMTTTPATTEFVCGDVGWCAPQEPPAQDGVCTAFLKNGSACVDTTQCGFGSACRPTPAGNRCTAIAEGSMACVDVGNGAHSSCPRHWHCSDGWCENDSLLADTCKGVVCQQNEYCRRDTKQCARLPVLDEPCDIQPLMSQSNAQLCLDAICDRTQQVCLAHFTCDGTCAPEFCVSEGHCRLPVYGDACTLQPGQELWEACPSATVLHYCVNGICEPSPRTDCPATL